MSKGKSANNWAACKSAMAKWPTLGMLSLIHDLYKLSEENRRFLHARLLPRSAPETLASVRRKLQSLLSTSAVWSECFRHSDVKKVIDQYEKATDDPVAVADLLTSDLEIAFRTFSETGDDERDGGSPVRNAPSVGRDAFDCSEGSHAVADRSNQCVGAKMGEAIRLWHWR